MSESENSETEERDKYKVHYKRDSETSEMFESVKPILARDKYSQQRKTANIEIAKSNADDKHSPHKRKSSFGEENAPAENVQVNEVSSTVAADAAQLEFKNDLIFDLDM